MEGQIVEFPIDHIVPRTLGGLTILQNLALACPRCNGSKWAFQSGFDLQTRVECRLFNPRRDDWHAHFEWANDSSLRILGKTAIGRVTVDRLKMNEEQVLAIRWLLWELGIDVMDAKGA